MSVATLFGRMFSKIVFTADFSMASLPKVLWDETRGLHVCKCVHRADLKLTQDAQDGNTSRFDVCFTFSHKLAEAYSRQLAYCRRLPQKAVAFSGV